MYNQQQLDSKLKCFPFLGTSPNLIERFLIIGYESKYIEQTIKNNIITETIPQNESIIIKDKKNISYNPKDHPLLLNSISSDYSGEMLKEDEIIKFSFPNPPLVYIIGNENEKIKTQRIVFYINNESFEGGYKKMTHGFTYVFYEPKIIETDMKKKYKILIPKAFTFISQYPFFNTFDYIANHLLHLFRDFKGMEIPLEILIYNIVNFVPSPINFPLYIQFFPSTNIASYAKNIISITQKQKRELQQEFLQNPLYSSSLNLDKEKYQTLQLFNQIQKETINKISLNQLNVYPYYDYNLVEIFRVLPLNILIRVFIFSFLDQELLIFSQNHEILNLTLYILSSLNYPFTDSMYFWHIISICKADLLKVGKKASPYVGKFFSSITGFNCKYDSKIKTTIHYKKPHFVIDLDNVAIYYKKGSEYLNKDSFNDDISDDELKELNEYESMNMLMDYIQKIFEGKKVHSVFLEKAINELKSKLTLLSEKAVGKKKEDISERFFIKDQGILFKNKIIQESFYSFILNIFSVLYECYSEKGLNVIKTKTYRNNKQNDLQNTNINLINVSNKNDINNDNNKKRNSLNDDELNENPEHKMYYLHYNDKDKYKTFSKEEKIFCNFFKASSKYGSFFKNFIELDSISELYLIPMMFVEEFLNIKKQKHPNIKEIKFLDIIDYFNPQHKKTFLNMHLRVNEINSNQEISLQDLFTELIDFRNFYAHYEQHMKNKINEKFLKHLNISSFKANALNTIHNKYKYNSIHLNNNLIQEYANLLSNYSQEQLIEIFPSIETKQQNKIPLENANKISKAIELSFIKSNILSTQDLIIFGILNIIGVYIEIIQSETDAVNVGEILKEIKYCMRGYLLMLTKFLYRITINKYQNNCMNNNNNNNCDISNELLYFQILFDSLRTNCEIPTMQLNIIACNFDKLAKEFEKNNSNTNNNKQHNENEMNVKEENFINETQNKYRQCIKLVNYKCQCNENISGYNDNFFYLLSKNIAIKKNISYICEDCDKQITPHLEFIHNNLFTCELYSPSKIYEQSSIIVDEYENNSDKSKVNKDICKGIILNLFYYATIIPNFKYSTCDILLRLFNTLTQSK